MPKLTKRTVESVQPGEKDIFLRDSELKGFVCKVTPRGRRVYMYCYRDKGGRSRKPAIGEHSPGLTCDQAREIAKDWAQQVREGRAPSMEKKEARQMMTLAQFAEVYLERQAAHLKPRSIEEEKRIWHKNVLPQLGTLRLNAVTRHDIDRLHQSMRDTPYMANRVLELLRRSLNLATEWGYVSGQENPCRNVKKFKEQSRERFLSSEELARLGDVLRQCEAEQVEMQSAVRALRLLTLTGCRKNEILQLRWDWIDFEHGKIDFPDSKTGKKSVYLNPPAIELLQQVEPLPDNPYVCPGKGGIGHLVNIQKSWNRIRGRAGLSDVRLHDLRHSFASVAAASGMSLYMIGKMLGHKDSSTTEKYAHLVGDPLREAATQIGNRIAATMEGRKAEVIPIRKG